ncbi:collagen-like triple helix repeat-containing protein [Halovivax limisalsi]|uniref:collagen-like triple helix repeat-containing protein n=1 Tax=Halovivax limisalsi TaxID=1453760 RepID=UPI001FFDD432|nr:collagen-like protein [Halovivax limisalsi]
MNDATNETTFDWGTVTSERSADETVLDVNVTVESEGGASVSAISVPNASERVRKTEKDAEYDSFEWGAVRHENDSDTGAVDVTVIVDAEENVSLSVRTVGENGSQSSSTTIVSASGEPGWDGENGTDGSASVAGEPGEDGEPGAASTNITVSQTTKSGAALGESIGSIDASGVSIDIDDGEDE